MKTFTSALCCLVLCLLPGLSGQEVEEVVIPTEISEPPYQVGNLISEQGYYHPQADGTRINFRIVDNRIRIYWLDENNLIMEPTVSAATVRFTGSVRGRDYNRATRLAGDVGLGAPGGILPPHTLNVVVVLESGEAAMGESFAFRYSPSMDVPKETQPEVAQ